MASTKIYATRRVDRRPLPMLTRALSYPTLDSSILKLTPALQSPSVQQSTSIQPNTTQTRNISKATNAIETRRHGPSQAPDPITSILYPLARKAVRSARYISPYVKLDAHSLEKDRQAHYTRFQRSLMHLRREVVRCLRKGAIEAKVLPQRLWFGASVDGKKWLEKTLFEYDPALVKMVVNRVVNLLVQNAGGRVLLLRERFERTRWESWEEKLWEVEAGEGSEAGGAVVGDMEDRETEMRDGDYGDDSLKRGSADDDTEEEDVASDAGEDKDEKDEQALNMEDEEIYRAAEIGDIDRDEEQKFCKTKLIRLNGVVTVCLVRYQQA